MNWRNGRKYFAGEMTGNLIFIYLFHFCSFFFSSVLSYFLCTSYIYVEYMPNTQTYMHMPTKQAAGISNHIFRMWWLPFISTNFQSERQINTTKYAYILVDSSSQSIYIAFEDVCIMNVLVI